MLQNIIYGLIDPRTQQLSYVGLSSRGLVRLRDHIKLSQLRNGHTHRDNWLKALRRDGLEPETVVLEEVISRDALNDAEVFWISYMRFIGCDLTNHTRGGGGAFGRKLSKKSRLKMSRSAKTRFARPEERARLSIAHQGKSQSPEARAKQAAALRGRVRSRAHCKNLAAAMRGKRAPFSARVNMSRARGGGAFVDQYGRRYNLQSEAARAIGVSQASVSRVLRGLQLQTKGYVFTRVPAEVT